VGDRSLFLLDAKARFRLAHDRQQWILQRTKKRKAPRRPKPPPSPFEGAPSAVMDWRAISFIGSTKRVLRRCICEAGVILTAEAQLDHLPEQFLDFIANPDSHKIRAAA